MPADVIRHYTEGQAERRRELIRLIEFEKQQYMARCQPYIEELVKIDNCTPVSYVIRGDDLGIIGITKEVSNS